MKISHEAKITIEAKMTFAEFVASFQDAGVPAEATPTVYHYNGDQRDPSYTTITWKWETGS